MDNPPQLKGEAPVEVAVLAVREEGDSDLDDDDEITPNPVGHKGLMRSARSSIEVRSLLLLVSFDAADLPC